MGQYSVALFKCDDAWGAQCIEVPGAISQGATQREALRNVKEVIALILECNREQVFEDAPIARVARVRVASTKTS